ncbi:uncharacterized protein LOC113298934 isoform X3 [Papaver somniferum]|uniref:uncharacterized protein LOC113298934 isoform X3 n=1 Tax=Papaver somniferum TaxID=3469 RepID=UPI000E6F5CE5|nr:uncharacterized protein LOC113298934 isoform X3 [Papaver somniferum]
MQHYQRPSLQVPPSNMPQMQPPPSHLPLLPHSHLSRPPPMAGSLPMPSMCNSPQLPPMPVQMQRSSLQVPPSNMPQMQSPPSHLSLLPHSHLSRPPPVAGSLPMPSMSNSPQLPPMPVQMQRSSLQVPSSNMLQMQPPPSHLSLPPHSHLSRPPPMAGSLPMHSMSNSPQQRPSLQVPASNMPQMQPPPCHLSLPPYSHLSRPPPMTGSLPVPSLLNSPQLPPMPVQMGRQGSANHTVQPMPQGRLMHMKQMHSRSVPADALQQPPHGGYANGMPNIQGPSGPSGPGQMYPPLGGPYNHGQPVQMSMVAALNPFQNGGTYNRKRFPEEGFPREATSPSYASYLETLMRDSGPPPAVGTWPQPRRKGFDEESALARDSRQHDKPYGDSFRELDRLQEPKKYCEIDNFQVVDKYPDSYRGFDSYYNHGHDGPGMLSRCNHFPPDDLDHRPRISLTTEVSHEQSCHDSRECDKKSSSQERDQSPERTEMAIERDVQHQQDGGGERIQQIQQKLQQQQKQPQQQLLEVDEIQPEPSSILEERITCIKELQKLQQQKKQLPQQLLEVDEIQHEPSSDGISSSILEERTACIKELQKLQPQQKQQQLLEVNEIQLEPSSHGISSSILEKRTTCSKEDQYPKAIMEANEISGPAAVMRFSNDPEVLQKLGDGIGFGVSSDVVKPTEYNSPDDNAEDKSAKEDTSTSSGISSSILVERITCIKENQYPKAIMEANEIGDPAVVMRFSNDPEVLQKLGDGMDFGVSSDVVNPTEYNAPDDNAEDKSAKVDTSVHQTDGVGDIEEMDRLPKEERIREKRKMSQSRSSYRKKIKRSVRRAALAAQSREDNAPHCDTGHERKECVTATSGNTLPIVEELEIGNLQHDFSSDPISASMPEENVEELMSCIKKDPYLKPIVEDIEIGGPTKEMDRLLKERLTEIRKMPNKQRSSKRKKFKRLYERAALAAQSPNVEELEIGNIQHDLSSDPISTSISEEDLEELMSCIEKDPYLKPIVEDIEIGGPTVMMRYLNDPEVLQKLGQAMGFGLSGEIVDTTEPNAPADYADDKSTKENDSIVYAGHKGNRGHKDVGNEGVLVPIWNEAIAAEQVNFYGFCYNCRERGHKASQCPKEKVQAGDKREQSNTGVGISNVQPRDEVVAPAWNEAIAAEPNFKRFCYNCRERGHKASQCPKEKVQTGDEREKPNTGVGNSNVQPHGQVVAPALNGAIAAKPTKFNRFCYNCRERGHKASQCPKEKVQAGYKLVQPDTGGRKQ